MAQWHKSRSMLIAEQKCKIQETLETNKAKMKKRKKKKKGKKKKTKAKKHLAEEGLFKQGLSLRKQKLRIIQIEFENMRILTLRAMCRGIFHFLAALKIEGVAPVPPTGSLLDMRTCFEKRFEAFTHLRQPRMLTYDGYVQACDLSTLDKGKETETLLNSASEWFDAAKSYCEKMLNSQSVVPENIDLTSIKSIMKTVVANRISLACVKRGLESKKKLGQCKVTYKYHPSWCVLKVDLV